MKRLVFIPLLFLLLPVVLALQHGHLIFQLDGWTPLEQSTDHQAYTKGEFGIDIRATTNKMMPPETFAELYEGSLEEGDARYNEFVVLTDEHIWIFAEYQATPELYRFTLRAPAAESATARAEMTAFLASLTLSDELVLPEAPWERELAYPDELPFLTKHPIPWDWIILLLIVGLIAYLIVRRVRKRKAKKHKGSHKDTHKDEHVSHKKHKAK